MRNIGIYVFATASLAAGILDLIWGELEPNHQPLQAWGDRIPGMRIIGYIAAVWLIAGGAAVLWRRGRQFGAAALTALYGIFILFPLPRFYTAPHYLGYRASVYIGVLASICQQVILFVAAAIVWRWFASKHPAPKTMDRIACWIFGFCSIDFGLTHLTGIQSAAPFVPTWIPFGAPFWVVLTGVAFVMAGVAIMAGLKDVLAAWLLGWMLLVFSAFSITPIIRAHPHDHGSWGANAYNLTAVGAAWIVAAWRAAQRTPVQPT